MQHDLDELDDSSVDPWTLRVVGPALFPPGAECSRKVTILRELRETQREMREGFAALALGDTQ